MPDEPGLLEVLERAARYREQARQFSDEQVRQALTEFAVGLEQRAKGLGARHWQNGKPSRNNGRSRRLRE